MILVCAKCGTTSERPSFTRSDTCSKCAADLKACIQCRHYEPLARWECRESVSERVAEKEKANFCEWFQPRASAAGGVAAAPNRDDLLKAADALFKKKT